MRIKPPFAYFGGKTILAERIASLLPEHRHYVEPFAGSLAVLLAKRPSVHETVNDVDGWLMNFWKVLRERPGELMDVCDLTPHSRGEYLAVRDQVEGGGLDDLELARCVWVTLSQGRGGTLRRTGWRFYRNPGGTGSSMPDYLDGYVRRMPACAERLKGVSLECRDALELIPEYGQHPTVLIYADPPYLGSSRASRQYRHELSHVNEHRDLATALHGCEAAVVLSGYHSPLYDELYGDWDHVEIEAFTGQANRHGRRVEVLWSNRPFAQRSLLEEPMLCEGAE